MKKWVKILLFLVIISLISGCTSRFSQDSAASSMVTSITVTCESCDSFLQRDYATPEKVRLILLCIRRLGPDFPVNEDVDALKGKTMCITLTCADNSITTYRIKNNLFVQKNAGHWRQIDPESAAGFYQLILQTPSDEDTDKVRKPLWVTPTACAHTVRPHFLFEK